MREQRNMWQTLSVGYIRPIIKQNLEQGFTPICRLAMKLHELYYSSHH